MLTRLFLSAVLLVLLGTAFVKLHLLLNDPFADLVTGYPVWLLWLSVYAELSVALAILDTRKSTCHKCWIVAVLFGLLAAVSVLRVIQGAESCGCFGRLTVPPSASLVLDLVLFGCAMWAGVANRGQVVAESASDGGVGPGRQLFRHVTVVAVATAATCLFIEITARVNSPCVTAKPLRVNSSYDQGPAMAVIELVNRSTQVFKVIGMERSCKCMAIGLPVVLMPGSTSRVPVEIKSREGTFRLILYLNSPLQQSVVVDINLVSKEGV